MIHIVFLDRATIDINLTIPAPSLAHHWQNYSSTSPEAIVERLRNADVAVTNKVVLDAPILRQLPSLKHIAITATGMNNVDLSYCEQNSISVSNVKGYGSTSVAEHGFMMLLALRRNLITYVNDVNQGLWESSDQFCHYPAPLFDLEHTVMTIIGQGDIGKVLAHRAHAFGMTVIKAEHKHAKQTRDGYTAFDEAITKADHIVVCCPLNKQTHHLIDQQVFTQMKPNSVVINLARGGIVDESALVNALDNKRIAGAATDVSVSEPLASNSPLTALKNRPNVIITPHVAWASLNAQNALLAQVVRNIERALKP